MFNSFNRKLVNYDEDVYRLERSIAGRTVNPSKAAIFTPARILAGARRDKPGYSKAVIPSVLSVRSPGRSSLYTVNKSPFVNKTTMEQFGSSVFKSKLLVSMHGAFTRDTLDYTISGSLDTSLMSVSSDADYCDSTSNSWMRSSQSTVSLSKWLLSGSKQFSNGVVRSLNSSTGTGGVINLKLFHRLSGASLRNEAYQRSLGLAVGSTAVKRVSGEVSQKYVAGSTMLFSSTMASSDTLVKVSRDAHLVGSLLKERIHPGLRKNSSVENRRRSNVERWEAAGAPAVRKVYHAKTLVSYVMGTKERDVDELTDKVIEVPVASPEVLIRVGVEPMLVISQVSKTDNVPKSKKFKTESCRPRILSIPNPGSYGFNAASERTKAGCSKLPNLAWTKREAWEYMKVVKAHNRWKKLRGFKRRRSYPDTKPSWAVAWSDK